MYQSFFGLEKNPFSITPDPNFLFLTAAHREALAGLLFAISCRKGFVVLTGDAGTGKTTLLRTMLRRVSSNRTLFSFVVHPTLSASEFLEYTLLDFGLKDIPASKAQRLNLFHQFLVRSFEEGKTPVLVVDEAQKLSPELLEEIRLLTNAETAEHKLLQIILAGQNELSDVLAREDMRQLRQRIAVRLTIGPLTAGETGQYMQSRWVRAGATQDFPFTSDAVEAVAQYSRGIPRIVNVLSDAALVHAFAMESHTVEASHIASVGKDLQLVPPTAIAKQAPVRLTSSPIPVGTTVPLTPGAPFVIPKQEHSFVMEDAPLPSLHRYMPSESKKPRLMRWATRLGLGGI